MPLQIKGQLYKKATKQQTKMPSRRSTCQERKVYDTNLEGIARDRLEETGLCALTSNFSIGIRYSYKDPQGRFVSNMEGRYILKMNAIIASKFTLVKDGATIIEIMMRKRCKPYPGSLSYLCRERTKIWHETESLIEYKPENAWTKCEIFYKGRWVKAHTVRECIELKGRLEFFDCE